MKARSTFYCWAFALSVLSVLNFGFPQNVFADDPNPEMGASAGLNFLDFPFQEVPQYDVASDAGMEWAYIHAWWRILELDQGAINFTTLDTRVNAAVGSGLEVVLTFVGVPHWAIPAGEAGRPGNLQPCEIYGGIHGETCCRFFFMDENGNLVPPGCSQPPLGPGYFEDFFYAVVDRYKEVVTHYEIWQEPNFWSFWGGSKQQWIDLIAIPAWAAMQRVRAENPGLDLKLIGPATANNFWADSGCKNFIDWAGPISGYLDIYSAHFVNEGAFQVTSGQGWRDLFTLYDSGGPRDIGCGPWISGFGGGKPFFCTSCDVNSALDEVATSNPNIRGESDQAEHLTEIIRGVHERPGFDVVMLTIWSDSPNPNWRTRGPGIVEAADRHHRPKKSFWDIRDLLVTGDPIARDTFSNNSTNREQGDPLDGSVVEDSALVWEADGSVKIGISEATNAGSGHHKGGLSFDPADYGSVVSLQGDVVVNWAYWVGIGFTESATGGFWDDGLLVARLHGQGSTCKILTQGPGSGVLDNTVYSSSVPSLQRTKPYRFKLQYDQCFNTLDAWFEGDQVVSGYSLGGFRPEIRFAGLHMNNAGQVAGSTSMTVDNFMIDAPSEPAGRPSIIQHPEGTGADAGGSAQIDIAVSAPPGANPAYQWQFNEENISNGPHYAGTNTSTLTVINATPSQTGMYRCIVSNPNCPFGIASQNAFLQVQQEFNGPHFLPGRIEAEDYDVGGESIAYHDTEAGNQCHPPSIYRNDDVDIQATADPEGGTYNIGYIYSGEWLEYTVDATLGGCYQFDVRVAGPYGGAFHFERDGGISFGGPVQFTPTGGPQTWETVTVRGDIPVGPHIIRMNIDQDYWNLNWINVTYEGPFVCPQEE
ncbi:MAG TPA: carbohydrate-binding protein [Thermoanaerobaculales bacterium]|nr:carbohydrate-binding protein [Thermoanaerobaculales bacterium]